MAITACPECLGTVSTEAPHCPHCGAPIAASSAPFGGTQKGATTRPGFFHDPNVGAVGCLVIVLVIAGIAWYYYLT